MFTEFLRKREFPVRPFLQELDKKQVFFLQFLCSLDSLHDIRLSFESVKDIDAYQRIAKQYGDISLKKLSKEEIIDDICFDMQELGLSSLIYKSLYDFSSRSKKVFPIPKLIAMNRFITIVFEKNIKSFLDKIVERKLPLDGVEEEIQKHFCFPDKPILNSTGLICLIGALAYMLEEEEEDDGIEVLREFLGKMTNLFVEQLLYIKDLEIQQLHKKSADHEITRQKWQDELTKQKELVKKRGLEVKELKKEHKKAEKTDFSTHQQETILKLQKELKEKDLHLELLVMQQKQKEKKTEGTLESVTAPLHHQINELKKKLQDVKAECKEWIKKVEQTQSENAEEKFLQYVEEKGCSATFLAKIEPYLERYKQQQSIPVEKEPPLHQEEIEVDRIGYCVVENHIHYVVFPDKSKMEITNIPDNVYLGEGQFVKVGKDGSFKWVYGYKFEVSDRDAHIKAFGMVVLRGEELYVLKNGREEIKLTNLPSHIQLRHNQVISLDTKNQLLRFYRGIHANANVLLSSIKAKGHTAYLVLKVFPNGLFLRNIENGQEEFRLMDTKETNRELKEQQVVCLQEDEVKYVFASSKFYTFSSLYPKAEFGMVEKNNDVLFVKKMSGEVAFLKDVPLGTILQEGQIIKVDEFNNFLFIKEEEGVVVEEPKRKTIRKPISLLQKPSIAKIQIRKNVLVLGKPTYENSYKMALLKNGYRAEVIDGYSSWVKIKSAIKGKDVVVLVTDFVSHDNMWKVKEEVLSLPVVYSKEDGANRIVEQVMELEQPKEVVHL